jgi:hypothetical protein
MRETLLQIGTKIGEPTTSTFADFSGPVVSLLDVETIEDLSTNHLVYDHVCASSYPLI